MFDYELMNFVKFAPIESIIRTQFDRIKPKFRFVTCRLDVDMRRLRSFVAKKTVFLFLAR